MQYKGDRSGDVAHETSTRTELLPAWRTLKRPHCDEKRTRRQCSCPSDRKYARRYRSRSRTYGPKQALKSGAASQAASPRGFPLERSVRRVGSRHRYWPAGATRRFADAESDFTEPPNGPGDWPRREVFSSIVVIFGPWPHVMSSPIPSRCEWRRRAISESANPMGHRPIVKWRPT
jgi:hypothetical protein